MLKENSFSNLCTSAADTTNKYQACQKSRRPTIFPVRPSHLSLWTFISDRLLGKRCVDVKHKHVSWVCICSILWNAMLILYSQFSIKFLLFQISAVYMYKYIGLYSFYIIFAGLRTPDKPSIDTYIQLTQLPLKTVFYSKRFHKSE
jgi:hypothetical protein